MFTKKVEFRFVPFRRPVAICRLYDPFDFLERLIRHGYGDGLCYIIEDLIEIEMGEFPLPPVIIVGRK